MRGGYLRPETSFPYVLGLIDGMLTALTLASGKVMGGSGKLDSMLAVRISAASAVSGAFVFFAAEYTRLRGGLVRAARQLNLRKAGRLASTRLGRWALQKAASGALASSVCNFCGALFPLLGGAFLPRPVWLAVALTMGALGVLGAVIAPTVHGSRVRWGAGLMIAGGALAFVGTRLQVI